MIELIQFPWSPFCIVQRRILEFSGTRFKITNIPNGDRSLVWKLTKQRYYGVPIIKDGKSVIFEVNEESQVIAKYLDGRLKLGLFPWELDGVQSVVWRYIEGEIESIGFKLNDVYWREMVPASDQLRFLRHKERKFGRGCISKWRADRKEMLAQLEEKLVPFEEMLVYKPFLLDQRPRFVDFNLYGMLANFLYSGHYRLPAAHTQLKEWYTACLTSNSSPLLVKKNYILDTNVLLHDPNSLLSFDEHNVLLPIEVIEEIDRFKRESTELGQNARTVSRMLDGFRGAGRLSEGVALPNGGQLRIIFPTKDTAKNGHAVFATDSVDNRILALAFNVKKSQPKNNAILVSKDINLRIKADALGMMAEDYENDRVLIKDLYTGMIELTISAEKMASFRTNSELELNGGKQYFPNEYCTLIEETNPKRTALTKVDPSGKKLVAIIDCREGIWGIKPRNREQHFGFDALLDDRIKLVTLMGKAGTGKTLLAMAAGLKRTVMDREFRRLVVARPTISMGKELGFLPGSLEEKLAPWMQPIHDALEMLGDLNMGHEHRRSGDLMRSGSIVVEALSYIRGRSIANQFMVIDEAQNLTPLEAKTIITRVGHGTKIIFTGDPYQIDNPYVDSSSNGFNYVVSRFRAEPVAAHIEFQKGERSELAELAANIL